MRHVRCGCSLCPSHHDRSPHRPTWRIAFGHCGIGSHQTSTVDRESLPPTCAQSAHMGPTDRRLVLAVDPASPSLAISDRIQAIDPVEFPSRSGSAQIQIPVFAKTPNEAGTRGPDQPLIRAVVHMKQHNPRWGCPRIAEQINLAFGTCINKDVVRRILAEHEFARHTLTGTCRFMVSGATRTYSSIDKIRVELAWVNETQDPNKCGCRNLRCCEETGHKPGACSGSVANEVLDFSLGVLLCPRREYMMVRILEPTNT